MFCCIEEVCGVGGMTLCTRRGSPASDSLVLLGSVSNSDLPAVSGSASPILLHDHETSGGSTSVAPPAVVLHGWKGRCSSRARARLGLVWQCLTAGS